MILSTHDGFARTYLYRKSRKNCNFFSNKMLKFLFWKPGLPQSLSCPWVIVYISILQGLLDDDWEELKLFRRPLQNPQREPGTVCLLPDTEVDKTHLICLGMWWLISQFPQRHLCLWIPGFCCWGMEHKQRQPMSPWCWLYYLYNYFKLYFL